jgi:hypothetical protein
VFFVLESGTISVMKKLFIIAPWIADFGHGILLTIFVATIFDIEATLQLFLFGLIFSVIPDLDGIKEFIRFKNIGGSKGRAKDHRDGLHFPLMWLLASFLFVYLNPVLGTLFFLCVFAHFLNDSWGGGWGVQWLWPFSKKSYKFFSGKDEDAKIDADDVVISWTPEEKTKAIEVLGNPNWLEDIYLKPTKISIIEYGTFVVAVIVLLIYLN